MKNIIFRIFILGSLVALTACGGGGGGTTTPPASTISLIAADSSSIDLQSTDLQGAISTTCYANNSNGIIETVSISGTTWTYTVDTYTGDTTCSNTPSTTTAVATLTIGSNQNVVSWENGTIPTYAATPSTSLPTNAPYTVISGEVTSSNNPDIAAGITFSSGYVIDNSSTSGVVLYRVRDTTTGLATNNDSYTDIVPASPPTVSGPEIQITIDEVINQDSSTSRIQYTIKNIGDTDTGSFYVVGWHNRASAPDYTSASSAKINVHSNLASGATKIAYVTIDTTTVTPGTTHNAYVIADFGEAITESDEGLTGTNDNLSTKAWTVSDIYIHNGTTYIDDGADPVINAEYHITYGRTDITFNRQVLSSPTDFNHRHTVKLLGALPVTDTTSTGYSSIRVDFYINGVYYTLPLDDTTSEIRIIQAGAVGEIVWGTYDVNLCPANDLGGGGTCNVSTVNHTGNFQIVRGADVTP